MDKLNKHILLTAHKEKTIIDEEMEECALEITTAGIISLKRSWLRFHYDGVQYNNVPSTILYINGKEHSSKYMNDEQVDKMKDMLSALFDEEISKTKHPLAKVKALYEIFKSPRMTNPLLGYNKMMDAIMALEDNNFSL